MDKIDNTTVDYRRCFLTDAGQRVLGNMLIEAKFFEYTETPDQGRSTIEVKKDMESVVPMDRLLCGDAGYGKTEVALRAAFKAVMSNKQVVILVPTTILAEQHFKTFNKRLDKYPVNTQMLSRFKSRKEQKEILDGLSNGLIDIIIGTHRLLSKDVKFHQLGLVIVDEEQRFGVVHKERLKYFKQLVDVLTLTATPIPRTLYMSLMGIRDLSLIETPPEERLAVGIPGNLVRLSLGIEDVDDLIADLDHALTQI